MIEIHATDKSKELAGKLAPAVLLAAAMRGINKENLLTVSHIQRTYLNFQRNGPTTLEGLRNRSGQFFRTLHASPATIVGDSIQSSIGTPATSGGFSYPRLHEFGGTVQRKPRIGAVRLRANKDGTLVRQGARGQLAVFARRKDKHTKSVAFAAPAHSATYPARAPIQRGIRDRLANYARTIEREIKAEVNRA